MLTYSPDAAFLQSLFQLVPSAIALMALAWIRLWERARTRAQGPLTFGVALLTSGFALQAAFCQFAVKPEGDIDASLAWLQPAADVCRGLASVLIGSGLLLRAGGRQRLKMFWIPALLGLMLGIARVQADLQLGLISIDPLTTIRVADAAILLLAAGLLSRVALVPSMALLCMGLGRSSALIGALSPARIEMAWGAGGVLTLSGLLLLAFSLESLSHRRVLQYVLRFNLTFLALAVSLIVALSEITRRQFIEVSIQHLQDIAELARGHMITSVVRGDPPERLLDRRDIIDRIVREFGRHPDLRQFRLQLMGQSMGLTIDATGAIDQRFWAGDRPSPPPVAPSDFITTLLMSRPVLVDGRPVGNIELYHSVVGLNGRLGQQMNVAFGLFTVYVLLGSILTGILVVVADETIRRQDQELAEARRRLLSSERLASVGAVADVVAHEVNNPAGVLIARSDYLLSVIKGQPWAAEIQDDLNTIRRQSQRIAKTVHDLLTATRRPHHGGESVDVGAVAQSAIALVRPLVQDRAIAFDNYVDTGTVKVWGDYGRIEQAFVNLLSNAAQAIAVRGTVAVTASIRPGGKWIDIDVSDTGAGIHPEHMHRIFERFFTTKEPGMGSGLGLSIVAGIVREHGGHIDVESKLGIGTRFRVSLRASGQGSEPLPDSRAQATAVRTPRDGDLLDG